MEVRKHGVGVVWGWGGEAIVFWPWSQGARIVRGSLQAGPWSRVWHFQVYCVQHPVLVAINRVTEEEGVLRPKSLQLLVEKKNAGNPGAEVDVAQTLKGSSSFDLAILKKGHYYKLKLHRSGFFYTSKRGEQNRGINIGLALFRWTETQMSMLPCLLDAIVCQCSIQSSLFYIAGCSPLVSSA